MSHLRENDYALLELSAMKPISYLPPFHLSIAEELSERGLLRRQGMQWHPTISGLRLLGRVVH